ncbi:hypothetical protein VNO80_23702 [Phaseolus coccineus]|uniref:FAD/NAD(P)-binding domain-containing protein n=1 Tax=Phaseolus coccineus TaxID=3886 RepID=A0AAN9MCQ1_PHACN
MSLLDATLSPIDTSESPLHISLVLLAKNRTIADLKITDTAIILGQGNVALDVARILLRPTTELATTDISIHALATPEESSIRVVYLVGRRGPAQAELVLQKNYVKFLVTSASTLIPSIHNVDVFIPESDLLLTSDDKLIIASVSHGKQIAIGAGKFEDIKCWMVLKSIGSKSVLADGLPFDHKKDELVLVTGNVTLIDNNRSSFNSCWINCGHVSSISEDLENGGLIPSLALPKPGRDGLLQLLHDRNVRIVSFSDWEKIDSEERRLGSLRN